MYVLRYQCKRRVHYPLWGTVTYHLLSSYPTWRIRIAVGEWGASELYHTIWDRNWSTYYAMLEYIPTPLQYHHIPISRNVLILVCPERFIYPNLKLLTIRSLTILTDLWAFSIPLATYKDQWTCGHPILCHLTTASKKKRSLLCTPSWTRTRTRVS